MHIMRFDQGFLHSLSSSASHLPTPSSLSRPTPGAVAVAGEGLMDPIPWQLMVVGKGRVSFL